MKTRDKLSTAPAALSLYDCWADQRRREVRLDYAVGVLALVTTVAFAALPFVLYWGDWLP